MKRFRLIGVSLLAVMALGAVVASGAQAESAPYFSIGGARLLAGKTHNIEGHGIRTFKLETKAINTSITCTQQTTEKGVLLGSEPGTQGKADLVSKFAGCTLEGNGSAAGCHLAEREGGAAAITELTTNPLHSELVENVVERRGGKILLELFTPATGSEFIKINFGPSIPPCEVLGARVTGSTVAEVVTDPGESNIELGSTTLAEGTSFITRFPTTAITAVWLVSGGTGKIVETGLELGSHPSIQTGTALVLLANSKFEGEPNAKWSPLP